MLDKNKITSANTQIKNAGLILSNVTPLNQQS